MPELQKQINVISILACDRCCDSVKGMARRGKAFESLLLPKAPERRRRA